MCDFQLTSILDKDILTLLTDISQHWSPPNPLNFLLIPHIVVVIHPPDLTHLPITSFSIFLVCQHTASAAHCSAVSAQSGTSSYSPFIYEPEQALLCTIPPTLVPNTVWKVLTKFASNAFRHIVPRQVSTLTAPSSALSNFLLLLTVEQSVDCNV